MPLTVCDVLNETVLISGRVDSMSCSLNNWLTYASDDPEVVV